jgi:hypothetical protein
VRVRRACAGPQTGEVRGRNLNLHRRLRHALIGVLSAAALASLLVGTQHALDYSQDLQWDEARLFLDGINPYLFYLEPGRPLPDYINPGNLGLTQMPSAVLLFAPIALPSFEAAKISWILVNLAATIGFILLALRLFLPAPMGWSGAAAFTLLLMASMPWRITLGNGQYGLVAMTLFLIALHFFRERRLGLATLLSALALVKYTLVLPFFALFLYRKRDLALVLPGALAIHACLTALAGWMTGERPDLLVLQSLRVATSITEAGAYDVFAFHRVVAPELGRAAPLLLSAVMIAVTIATCWRGAGLRELAAVSIVSIVIVYHRSYDAFVLMFLALHLQALGRAIFDAERRPALIDLAEFHLGCGILLYAFFLDQLVYALAAGRVHAGVSAGFSALLYAYLFLLFFRSFRERAGGAMRGPLAAS